MNPADRVPCHPCGHKVDPIKTPYVGRMRFFEDDQEREILVAWTYAKEDAPGMPWPYLFGAHVWQDQRNGKPTVGEVGRVTKEKRIPDSEWFGARPCGSIEVWQRGADEDTPLLVTDDEGVPVCCRRPVSRLGVEVGFELVESPPATELAELGVEVGFELVESPPATELAELGVEVGFELVESPSDMVEFGFEVGFELVE